MKLQRKTLYWINAIILIAILAHAILRDCRVEKQYSSDLRNRIVGARLQKDQKLPYLYNWHAADGVRYYDPSNIFYGKSVAGSITASPFFHQLLLPICDLPQKTLSRIWLLLEYLSLFTIIMIMIGVTKNTEIKWLIVNAGILFTLTEAWKFHIQQGQLYIIVALLMSGIIAGFVRNTRRGYLVAGLCAVIFLLLRPTGAVIFIPCLLFFKRYRLFLITTATGMLLYGVYVLMNPFMVRLYENYFSAMRRQVQQHQEIYRLSSQHPADQAAPPKTEFAINYYEGIDLTKAIQLEEESHLKALSENGNVFIVFSQLTGKKLSLPALNAGCLIILVALSAIFYWNHKKSPGSALPVIQFGLTLYLIVDLFMPVYRHQYNTVQWLPLILSALLLYPNWKSRVFILLCAGYLLNISNFSFLPMRHTIGEFVWLAAMLSLSLTPRLKPAT